MLVVLRNVRREGRIFSKVRLNPCKAYEAKPIPYCTTNQIIYNGTKE